MEFTESVVRVIKSIPPGRVMSYGGVAAAAEDETVVDLQYKLLWVLYVLQEADARPTTAAKTAVVQLERSLAEVAKRWQELQQ